MKGVTLPTETVFVMEASPIKFGLGATDEIAYDARRLGLERVLIVTDPHIGALGLPERVRALLDEEGVKADLYDGVEIEPTDRSMEEAAEYARQREFDGLIGVGGGSALDTCKAINLLTTHPAPLLDYVNQPVGRGRPVPGPLKPLIAVPTTAGTGSETTAVAVTHVLAQHVKAGVSHRLLRPALGIVDPLNTLTAPPEVTAAAGCDIVTPDDRTLLARLAESLEPQSEILEAYLFGSTATGSAQAHSDLDVAVYLGDPRPAASPFGYAADLTATLMRALGTQRVDVVVLNEAPPLLYHRVLRDGIRILARDLRATTTRAGRALSRYCDYAPQLAKIEAAHRARIEAARFGR